MAQYGYQQPNMSAHAGAHGAGSPFASGSGSATPLGGSTRSGRVVKPVQPYTAPVQPPRGSSSRAKSGLNPLKGAPAGPPPPPQRHPLSLAPSAVPPMTRITVRGNEGKQGMFTTYPARMRLGTSSLMQPNAFAGTSGGTPTGANVTGTTTPVTGGKRSRTAINYAELETLDDLDEDGDAGRNKRGGSGTPAAIAAKKAPAAAAPIPPPKPDVWGDGKSYLGALPPGNLVQVQPAKATKHVSATEEQLEEYAERPAALVPVQIDLDVDTFKIRDTFVWNALERHITPAAFARVFCDDLDLDTQTYAKEVERQLAEQVEEQAGLALYPLRSEEEEAEMVEKDLRVIINLDVQIGTLRLQDKLEWDLSSSLTPELFAASLCRDLSLSSNAAPLIAHALHEELIRLKRSCLEIGLLNENDTNKARRGAKMLEGVWRDWNEAQNFGPKVERLTLDELDKVEQERERANRRAKRDRVGVARNAPRPKR